jgi:RNA polymerase sigma factor (sigma-70 family)
MTSAVIEVRPDDESAVQRVEQWFHDYAENRDPAVRERIILAYLGLADRLADRYRGNRAVSLEDLRQVARLGLIKAVDRYQPQRANPFVPYAVATVVGELKRHLRDASWRLRVPRGTKDLTLRLCRAVEELPQRIGRSPTIAELAEFLDASEEQVLEAIEVAQTRSAPSLDQPAGEEGDGRSSCSATSRSSPRTRSPPACTCPRCTSRGCCDGPSSACAASWSRSSACRCSFKACRHPSRTTR